MCGFVGGTDKDWDYRSALKSISHRGPDSEKISLEGKIKVGFKRLSIIDLSEDASQPMYSRDKSVWLVFNGEIYGYHKIRKELERLGQKFYTNSDTEVILNAYIEWKDSFIDHLDGMFSIAIWDNKINKIKLYRDRPGIKPLYYFYNGKKFAFSSELKALEILLKKENLIIDETALYDFLGYKYIPDPKSLYKKCYKLPPAHFIEFDPTNNRITEAKKYWQLNCEIDNKKIGINESCEELRYLVKQSIQDQMISDVPLGFFLSGGVDSSIVTAVASSIEKNISTFSIGFESDKGSETKFSKIVAKQFNTNHHEKILSQSNTKMLLPNLKNWFDEPFADESAMPTFLVSKIAKDKVKVVLTGDGGDEVFGGYRTYPRFIRYNKLPSLNKSFNNITFKAREFFNYNKSINKLMDNIEMTFNQGSLLWSIIMSGMIKPSKKIYAKELGIPDDYDDCWFYNKFWRESLPIRTRLQFLDFHTYMPCMVLTKVDRTSMAVSLEARVPLLSKDIIEFSFSLPEKIRLYKNQSKGIFKEAYRNILPNQILDRKKQGFGLPSYYLKDINEGRPIQEHILNNFLRKKAN